MFSGFCCVVAANRVLKMVADHGRTVRATGDGFGALDAACAVFLGCFFRNPGKGLFQRENKKKQLILR